MPIINPWHIYLLSFFDAANQITAGLIALFLVVMIFVGLLALEDKELRERLFRYKKAICAVFAALVLLQICLPSTKTATMMVAASYLTQENIQINRDTIKEMFDYITDSINSKKRK